MGNFIQVGRTFPLEQFANLKVTLESEVGFDSGLSEEERKVLRLALLAEVEQAYYEYTTIVSSFNLGVYKDPKSVIRALESFRKDLYSRLKLESVIEEIDEDQGE